VPRERPHRDRVPGGAVPAMHRPPNFLQRVAVLGEFGALDQLPVHAVSSYAGRMINLASVMTFFVVGVRSVGGWVGMSAFVTPMPALITSAHIALR
jgi:hypothetical protein